MIDDIGEPTPEESSLYLQDRKNIYGKVEHIHEQDLHKRAKGLNALNKQSDICRIQAATNFDKQIPTYNYNMLG